MITAQHIAQLIRDHDAARPRSRQTDIGPSGLGHPCPRNLLHHALHTPRQPRRSDPLPAWIGTAAHHAMEQAVGDHPDWLAEQQLTLPGYNLTGTMDAYHKPTRTIVDWKFTGATTITRNKANLDPQYRVQVHLYGLMAANNGIPVRNVAVCFIPRNGNLGNIHLHHEPWDEDIAEQALRRWDRILTLATLGPAAAALTPAKPHNCCWCPWYQPGSTDPAVACDGEAGPPAGGPGANPTRHQPEGTP